MTSPQAHSPTAARPAESRPAIRERRARPAGIADTPHEPRLARVAALVADASRARMLCFLLTGEYASAGELARAASISPATASGHLAQLTNAGLLICEARGRHRYFRLADPEICNALEALALVAERGSHERLWTAPARERLREARCCYGHLAGRRGVGLLRCCLERGWLLPAHDGEQGRFVLTENGASGLAGLGFDGPGWRARMLAGDGRARRLAHACLDWSERRDHLAGPFAVALLTYFCDRGWMRRETGGRALSVTPPGRLAIGELMGMDTI
jgi:DNA-binding transcriptional ArsR family regulator